MSKMIQMMRSALWIVFLLVTGATCSLAEVGAFSSDEQESLTEEPQLFLFAASTQEKLGFLSSTLGSNMVLQRDQESRIWGFTQSGATIVTLFKGYTLVTKADSNGVWKQTLPPQPATLNATFIAMNASTGETALLQNILFGDVYICGGQSNMQFSIPATTNHSAEALLANDYPHIRLFTVGQGTSSDAPLQDLQTIQQEWSVANSTTVSNGVDFGQFSAVCWFFGRTIADGLNNQVPLGLISNNWGGTSVEQWSTTDAFHECNRTNEKQGTLYNAMIHPYTVGPMAVTGFAWYQGESNTKDQTTADAYACLFSAMIQEWRNAFQTSPDAYFGFVQLSTWCPPNPLAVPELREAQMAALLLGVSGKVGYATNADYGAGCNIHPPTKQPCGIRLGNSALALHYNKTDIQWKSPSYTFANAGIRGREARVAVDLADVSDDGLLTIYPHNQLAGTFNCTVQEPGTCAWASIHLSHEGWVNATIVTEGEKLVLTATVTKPRQNVIGSAYGWGSVPMLNVYDAQTNLPVLPWNKSVSAFAAEQALTKAK
jgi:sialate O-acetylesterase